MSYIPSENRYDTMKYNRCPGSGLKLPALSLGLWHNFGNDTPYDLSASLCRAAFDNGITHFDLANNYGPPPGSAEVRFGQILRDDFAGLRDELIISTKAGYEMWDGPYGEFGSRKSLMASLDQSLKRMDVDYVDIFYSHRFDPETPLEETMGALSSAVKQGKALYIGISSYNSKTSSRAAKILAEMGTPCLIGQPSYSMLNRWIEKDGLLQSYKKEEIGTIAFSPLAQGLLTNKYLADIPEDSRAENGSSFKKSFLSEENLTRIRELNAIAANRGQSLAQMAIAWVLRDPRITSALIGASRPEQIYDCVASLKNTEFSEQELKAIDMFAQDGGVNLWRESSNAV